MTAAAPGERVAVDVIGAGLSGLAAAWSLASAGCDVCVREAATAPGGLLQTRSVDHGLIETAARGFLWTERVGEIFRAAGLTPQFADDRSKRRYIFRGGRPRRWPLGIFETLSLVGHGGLAFVTRQTRPRAGESVATWGERVVGHGATTWLLGPALQGIYASPPEALSAQAIFGGRRARGRLAAPPGGMGELIAGLQAALAARGVRFEFGHAVERIEAGRPTILATNAPAAARLLAPHAPALSAAVGRVRMTWLLSLTAFYTPQAGDPHGFGILFPRGLGVTALGVLFNADMFAGRSDVRSETWIYGDGSRDTIAALQARVDETLAVDRHGLTGRRDLPRAVYVTPTLQALPVYDQAVIAVQAELGALPAWLAVCGNYLGRLGVAALLDAADEAARRVRGADPTP